MILLSTDKQSFGVFALTYTPPSKAQWQLLEQHPIEELRNYQISVEESAHGIPRPFVKVCAAGRACVGYFTVSPAEPLKPHTLVANEP